MRVDFNSQVFLLDAAYVRGTSQVGDIIVVCVMPLGSTFKHYSKIISDTFTSVLRVEIGSVGQHNF